MRLDSLHIVSLNNRMITSILTHSIKVMIMKNMLQQLVPSGSRFFLCGLLVIGVAAITMSACRTPDHSKSTPVPAASDEKPAKTKNGAAKQKADIPPHSILEYSTYGTPSHIKGENLAGRLASQSAYQAAIGERKHEKMTFLWLEHYRQFLKLDDPRRQLRIESAKTDQLGSTHIKMLQVAGAVPVWQKSITLHFNRNNALYLFQGDYMPGSALANVDPSRAMPAAQASAKALAAVTGDKSGWQVEGTSLVIYAGGKKPPRTAYVVILNKGLMARDQYIVDAVNGVILDKSSRVRTGIQPMPMKIK